MLLLVSDFLKSFFFLLSGQKIGWPGSLNLSPGSVFSSLAGDVPGVKDHGQGADEIPKSPNAA